MIHILLAVKHKATFSLFFFSIHFHKILFYIPITFGSSFYDTIHKFKVFKLQIFCILINLYNTAPLNLNLKILVNKNWDSINFYENTKSIKY